MVYLLNSKGAFYDDEVGYVEYDHNNEYDSFNQDNSRDYENAYVGSYNCFGFALGTYNWGAPVCIYKNTSMYEDCIYNNIDYHNKDYYIIKKETIDLIKNYFIDTYGTLANFISQKSYSKFADYIMNGYNYGDSMILELANYNMLAAFPDMRRIDSFDELQDDEYGIVYAACYSDFHYGIKYKGEEGYYHKMGHSDIEWVYREDDIFGARYDSKRYYYAKKKDKNFYKMPNINLENFEDEMKEDDSQIDDIIKYVNDTIWEASQHWDIKNISVIDIDVDKFSYHVNCIDKAI